MSGGGGRCLACKFVQSGDLLSTDRRFETVESVDRALLASGGWRWIWIYCREWMEGEEAFAFPSPRRIKIVKSSNVGARTDDMI